ncbi:hypothetical protein C7U57_07135 [Pseudomonas sp. R9.37]|nr:hypothetical protein C7U57_07135 [Pseudomonas sp. R9.37]
MVDGASTFQAFVNFTVSLYSENKGVISFLSGAIVGGIPHVYKIYKYFSDRKDLKDRIREELVQDAHESRAMLSKAFNLISEMRVKSESGMFYNRNGFSVSVYLAKVEHEIVRPALQSAEEFYLAVSDSDRVSLKKLKGYRMRAKKIKHTNELALEGFQARLRELGVSANFVK